MNSNSNSKTKQDQTSPDTLVLTSVANKTEMQLDPKYLPLTSGLLEFKGLLG